MALYLPTEYPNGCTAEYHKITRDTLDRTDEGAKALVTIYSYLTKAKRDTAPEHMVASADIDVALTPAQENGATVRALYNTIKALPDWTGAEDC